jgi:hypothetical protein
MEGFPHPEKIQETHSLKKVEALKCFAPSSSFDPLGNEEEGEEGKRVLFPQIDQVTSTQGD